MKFLEFNPTVLHATTLAGEISSYMILFFLEEYPLLAGILVVDLMLTGFFAMQMCKESNNQA